MRINRILFALAFLACVPIAYGQFSKSTVQSQVASQFPDQNTGAITPATTRAFLNNLVNSYQQYAGINAQVGTTYTIQASDYGQLVTFTNALPVAVTIPQATGTFQTFNTYLSNVGAGTVTVTPGVGSTINGASNIAIPTGMSIWVVSDGTNYQVTRSFGSFAFGTAAFQNIGTSGGNVPLMTGANTWSGAQTFSPASTVAGTFKTTGGSSSFVVIDTSAGSQLAGFFLADNTVNKWNMEKNTDNTFVITDVVGAYFPFQIVPGTVTSGNVAFNGTLDASSSTVAGAVFSGGVAVAKKLNVGGDAVVSGGILRTTFGTPTIANGACGAGANGVITSGSNQSGLVTIGAAATTTCTISFSNTLSAAPAACVLFPQNAAAAATATTTARISSIASSQFVVTGTTLANTAYYWHCY